MRRASRLGFPWRGPILLAALLSAGLGFAPSARAQDTTAQPADTAALPDTAVHPFDRALQPPIFSRAALPVRFSFTGDINLGTITLPDGIPPDSGVRFLSAVDSLLVGRFVIGNFEGTLADSGYPPKCGPPPDSTAPPPPPRPHCYAFGTPSYLADRLKTAGFTHLNLANNHSHDFGPEGFEHTEWVLDSLGLRHYGPLGEISIDTVQDGNAATIIGLIGFSTYAFAYDLLDLERSAAVVDSVRQLVDLVVVTFHGGTEGAKAVRTGIGKEFLVGEPRGDLRRWARAVIDAGAAVVIGHGPHVLRGIEFYRGRPIFYSLGNFATYRGFNLEGPLGISAVLQLELAGDGGFNSGRMVPLVQVPLEGPAPDSLARAVALLKRVTRLDFPGTGARIGTDGTILPPNPRRKQ